MLSSLDGLKIVDRRVLTPGEFFGEAWYVPYFAQRVKERHYNYLERSPDKVRWSICVVTEAERKMFPDLEKIASVGISWDGGMCNSWVRSCVYRKVR